jgi:hypothetical protein
MRTVGTLTMQWMAEVGAFVLRIDTDLLLKSRQVEPGRLLYAGFRFDFQDWQASADLVVQSRHQLSPSAGDVVGESLQYV